MDAPGTKPLHVILVPALQERGLVNRESLEEEFKNISAAAALSNVPLSYVPPLLEAPLAFSISFQVFAIVGPAAGTVLGAWLHARYGRKVRLKVGDIEAEAQTPEQVEKLLAHAQEIQQQNQPRKVIT